MEKIIKTLVISLMIGNFVSAQVIDIEYKSFCSTNYRQIRYGKKSEAISDLQKILNIENNSSIAAADFFGTSTKNNIKKLQKKYLLAQTGVLGPATYKLLSDKYCKIPTVPNNTLNTNIPSNKINEVADGYIIYEEKNDIKPITVGVYNPNNVEVVDKSKMKIYKFEVLAYMGMGGNSSYTSDNNLSFNWEVFGVNNCNIYFVSDSTVTPYKREILFKDIVPLGATTSRDLMATKTNNPSQNYSVYQLDCKNLAEKKIVRKTYGLDWRYVFVKKAGGMY